jgi:hypothetical protein
LKPRWSRRSPPRRCARTRRDATEATRRWRAHQRGAQDGASGMLPPLALGRSSADELGRLLATARKRERRNQVNARVSVRASARFCSAGFLVRALDANGWLMITGPSRDPGGKRLSRSRPRLRPGARDAPSASGPTGRFRLRAEWRPGARDALSASGPTGRFSLRAEWRPDAQSAVCASRPCAIFLFGPNFCSEQ